MKQLFSCFFLFAILLQSAPSTAADGDAAFAVSPESAFSLIEGAIRDARDSIEMNIYMLTNRSVTQLLADKAQSGVKVTVLIEGETFGGEMLAPVKRVLDDLYLRFEQQSNGRGKLFVMTSQAGNRRYTFNHAKYMIVDGRKTFVSSENITGSAFNSKNLTGGTRGWEIYLENLSLARTLSKIFQEDIQGSDVLSYEKVQFKVKDPGGDLPPRHTRDVKAFGRGVGRFSSASVCDSPKSQECVLKFIRSAKKELSVEHLSLPLRWSGKTNPIVQELVKAAKKGVKVRVLLNDDDSFGDEGGVSPADKNLVTVKWLKEEAARGGLPLQAATFSNKALEVNYVHNKGMVADESRVFVSSINGTENSVVNNREIAVSVNSADAANYFGEVFDLDWNLSNR
ncbi:MAG TPA: phospholipase D-like domain-containing protein [Bdellovibrionota bacterium]